MEMWTGIEFIDCARFQLPTSNGTSGMTYQERNEKDGTLFLLDFIMVDQQIKTVRFIRFGTGEDREIYCGQNGSGLVWRAYIIAVYYILYGYVP